MKYNFDEIAKRENTYSLKYDDLKVESPMWVADMDFKTYPGVIKAIEERTKIGAFGYSLIPDEYFDTIISWWKRRHNVTFNKEWMIFSSGVVCSLSSIVRKLTSVGENVLIQSPCYNIFYNSIVNNGRNIVSNDLVYENGEYHIDFIDLDRKLSNPQTSMMILCNPHNPIGKIWTKEELEQIGFLAKKHNVIVVSDEIHCDFVSPSLHYVPFYSVNETNRDISITLVSPGKTFNLAGLHTSCAIIKNPYLKHKVWRGLNTDEVAEPNFFAIASSIGAYKDGDEWVDELNEYIYENKKIFTEMLNKEVPFIHVVPSNATYLLWIDISSLHLDSVSFTKYLLETVSLRVSDGLEYGHNGDNFIRINLATNKENVIKGANKLIQAILKLNK